MATKSINTRPSGDKQKDIFSADLPNIDANYGPWDSEEAYMSWLSDTMKVEGEPLEGTQIAVKDSETGKISVKIFSDGEFVDIGSGKVDYEETDAGVDYASLNVVSYNPQLGKSPEAKFQARQNIGALGQGDLDGKQDKLTNGTPLFKYNNKTVGYGNELPEGFFGGGGGSSTVADAVLVSGNQSIDGEKTFNDATNLATANIGTANISGQLKYTKKNSGDNGIGAGVLMRDGQGNVSSKAVSALGVSYNDLSNKPTPVKPSWTAAQSSDAYIENKPDISTNTNTGTTTTSGNFAVGGNLAVDGNTTLGDSATDTITLNGIITSDVTIGKNDSAANNKNLTVNGDVASGRTFTQVLQVHNNTTLGTATTQSQTSDSSTVINGGLTLADIAGTNGGVLRVDSNGAVYADSSSYITGSIMVDTYDDLPTSGIEPGEVRFIRDTGKISTALQVVADTKLYVSIPNVYVTEANANKRVLEEMCTEERPLVQYSTFLNNFSEIVDEHNAEDVYGDYPAIPYREHKLTESAGDDLYVIPVQHDTYGKIMIAISKVSGKAWIVPTSSVGAINTWYVDEVGSTGGLSTGSLIEITDNYDDLPDDLTNVREFMTFGGSVIWSK